MKISLSKYTQIARLYYNYVLVRLHIRHILPAFFINKIKVEECGEKLVVYQDVLVRKSVAKMLDNAQSYLPLNYSIYVKCGFRSSDEQANLRTKYQENSLAIAKESGHQTGGAVDVILLKNNQEQDCGSSYLEFHPQTRSYDKSLNITQKNNRKILHQAMKKAGFVNYPYEWWHYSYGDQLYVAYKRKKIAIYDKI